MILISNIGNRDIVFDGEYLERDKVRQLGEELLEAYEEKKERLTYPILEPFMKSFADKLKNIYFFVSNQEDRRVRDSDTIHLGAVIKKWVRQTYNIQVNVVQYTNDPTNYEKIYHFYCSYFTQENNIIKKADRRIISLSGGTPQMNGALYVILSSLFLEGNEFYSVFAGDLISINHESTINKIFVKKSCLELLIINQYQSIINLLEKNNIKSIEHLISLLRYAQLRKTFNFDNAKIQFVQFLKSIPSVHHREYDILLLENISDPINLIKELFWNMELSYKNQNYLFLVALIFRLEEALLIEIVKYLYKNTISLDLNKKKTHPNFITFLEKNDTSLWNSIQAINFKGFPLNVTNKELSRPVLYFIAKLKLDELKEQDKNISQVRNLLDLFDRINKYSYEDMTEQQRFEKYKDRKSKNCVGDLRNSSIIAHGFASVSKEDIEKLYGDKLEQLIHRLKANLKSFLVLSLNNKNFSLNNIFHEINKKIENYILQL